MSAHTPPDQSAQLDARVTRIEESLGYTERAVEQLSSEIADINKRLQSLTKRLATLEDRIQNPRGDAGAEENSEAPR